MPASTVAAVTNGQVMEQFGATTELWCPSTGKHSTASEVLANKVVVLYFSAHWCPPCRKFTPLLKTIYHNLKSKPLPVTPDDATTCNTTTRTRTSDFEIVYCSLDNYTSEYNEYTAQMPWWCLPHQSPVVDKLRTVYKAEGIPHLCVVDKDGTLLCGDAVNEAMEDTEGARFPWECPQSIEEILPDTYVRSDGSYHRMDELDGKYLMIYFSAQWCNRSTLFTRKLIKAYNALKRTRDDFEILFVSSDRDRRSFKDFFSEMPFGAIPFGDRYAKNKLAQFLGIRGIPTLLMFGPRPCSAGTSGGGQRGNSRCRPLLNANVREIFERGDYIKEFPYCPKAFGDINETTEDINSQRFIIVFHEAGDDHEQDEIKEAICTASKKMLLLANQGNGVISSGSKPIKLCWAFCSSGLCESLRLVLRLGHPKETPTMVLLDIPDSGAYYVCQDSTSDITADSILNFIRTPGTRLQIQ